MTVYVAPAPRPSVPTNGLAVASFVVALVGLLLFLVPGVAFILGLLSLIFGVIGLQRVPRFHGEGKVMSIWGLAIGGFELLVSVLWLVVGVIAALNNR